jgi:hypothetical protein
MTTLKEKFLSDKVEASQICVRSVSEAASEHLAQSFAI